MLFLKIIVIVILGSISYQDFKDREVYIIIFPVLITLLGFLHYQNVEQIHFLYAIGINTGVLIGIMGLLYLYTILKLKRSFFKEVFGTGDLLFFIALAAGFPTITFIVVLVFSLFFSLLVSIIVQKKQEQNTVPLAGYMALFLGTMFIVQWTTNALTMYRI